MGASVKHSGADSCWRIPAGEEADSQAQDGDLVMVLLQSYDDGARWQQASGTTGWTELSVQGGAGVWYKTIGRSEADPVFESEGAGRCAYASYLIGPEARVPWVKARGAGKEGDDDD
jgi:hypothetical protein